MDSNIQIVKLTVVWASKEDKMFENVPAEKGDPLSLRVAKIEQMIAEGKTDGKLEFYGDQQVVSMNFVSVDAAKEWETFIQDLANTYGKKIITTSISVT